ncbi:MAG: GHMP kinase [Bacteriovoracaceae bacterium]|nr:GHMP kinase [Bacteriovoracaceae bacterium]
MFNFSFQEFFSSKFETFKHKNVNYDQHFYSHGKLLLSGEYFVLDGAKALVLPTNVGQSLYVEYTKSYNPKLTWESYDIKGNLWAKAVFELWQFELIDTKPTQETLVLQKIFREVRKLNPHFLRDEVEVLAKSKIEFPLKWGFGSSSTLIYNIAKWANVNPFTLLSTTFGGSGYDIAAACSDGPIFYDRENDIPKWKMVQFNPPFKKNIYFIYLGKKQSTQNAINFFRENAPHSPQVIEAISKISNQMPTCKTLEEFEQLINAHENLVSENLGFKKVKENLFPDYWGEIKSLGAWGGDFVLATSKESKKKTQKYFFNKGLDVFIPFSNIVITPKHKIYPSQFDANEVNMQLH